MADSNRVPYTSTKPITVTEFSGVNSMTVPAGTKGFLETWVCSGVYVSFIVKHTDGKEYRATDRVVFK